MSTSLVSKHARHRYVEAARQTASSSPAVPIDAVRSLITSQHKFFYLSFLFDLEQSRCNKSKWYREKAGRGRVWCLISVGSCTSMQPIVHLCNHCFQRLVLPEYKTIVTYANNLIEGSSFAYLFTVISYRSCLL